MAIVRIEKLDLDAAVPHSLDNQSISDKLLREMVRTGQTFNSPRIKLLRSQQGRRELMRSLLYAKEVVVNRASLVNTPYLFEHYGSSRGAGEFSALMNSGAIVPFVTGDELLAGTDFQEHPKGAKALEKLLPLVEGAKRASLDASQAGKADHKGVLYTLGSHFTRLLAGLDKLDTNGTKLLLRELGASAGVHSWSNPDLTRQFQCLLQKLAQMAREAETNSPNKYLTRETIYERLFCVHVKNPKIEKPVARGMFLPELAESPALLLLKKLVDLTYNFNLSDHLGCFSLTAPDVAGRTPVDLIRRAANVSRPIESKARAMGTEEERLWEVARRLTNDYLKKSTNIRLPNLEQLNIKDVHAIRQHPKWNDFITSKGRLLDICSADDLPNVFDDYVHRHRELHETMFQLRTTSVVPQALVPFTPYIEPAFQFASAALMAVGEETISEICGQIADYSNEPTLDFGFSWANPKLVRMRSSLSFLSSQRVIVPTHYKLSQLSRKIGNLESGARNNNNRRVEQSKS